LDLDNTLWGGIIGEDGIEGIKLSEDGIGKVYRDFQFLIKGLKDIGIPLGIVSKNNINDAKEVFEKHPMMVLKFEDFIIKKINWNNKVDNIKEIAKELNLGVDSFVFIDDNPVERDIVRQYLPEVVVPDFPEKEITELPEWFINEIIYNYFARTTLTEEDKEKTEQYKSNLERKKLMKKLNIDDFIDSLKIKLNFYVNDKRFIERTAQQTQKTNQFNLTTRRYTVMDIEKFINSEEYIVFNLEYEDKFGNEGIIGTAIVKLEEKGVL
jgi:FkbH-like protein